MSKRSLSRKKHIIFEMVANHHATDRDSRDQAGHPVPEGYYEFLQLEKLYKSGNPISVEQALNAIARLALVYGYVLVEHPTSKEQKEAILRALTREGRDMR